VVLSSIALTKMADQSDRILQLAQTNRELSRVVLDCTRPSGQCFEDGQRRTGTAVGNINEVTIAASFCAKTLPTATTVAALRQCIEKELDK
jgi:hypothetical protein